MPDEPVRCAESAGCLAILSRSVMFTLFFVLFCFLLLLLLLLFLLLFLFLFLFCASVLRPYQTCSQSLAYPYPSLDACAHTESSGYLASGWSPGETLEKSEKRKVLIGCFVNGSAFHLHFYHRIMLCKTSGDQLLAKEREDIGYEIAYIWKDISSSTVLQKKNVIKIFRPFHIEIHAASAKPKDSLSHMN